MRAGNLRYIASIQEFSSSSNSMGVPVETWSDVSGLTDIRVELEFLSGREVMEGAKLEGVSSVRISMYYRSGIKPKNRVKVSDPSEGTRYFNILSVGRAPRERNRLLLMCEEIVE